MKIVSEKTRSLLVQSLPAVELHHQEIQRALARSLASDESEMDAEQNAVIRAALLLSFLTRQTKEIVAGRVPRDLDLYLAEHRLNGIDGRHYSRFGDALVPALRDCLGPAHPRETGPAWCDAFWAVVQRMHKDEAPATPTLVAELVG